MELYLIIAGGGKFMLDFPSPLVVDLDPNRVLMSLRSPITGLGSTYRVMTIGSGVGPIRLYLLEIIFRRIRRLKMKSPTRSDRKIKAPRRW